ncbi:MAG: sodium-translocating pyrophosphatase [Bacteroidota bacterium]
MENILYAVPALGVLSLLFVVWRSAWVTKQDAGNEKMQQIAGYIADGAMAFLKAEYKILVIFAAIASVLLFLLTNGDDKSSPLIIVAFLIGAFFSGLAGFIGMRIATKANVRTAQAARTSLSKALDISFAGGSVMGMGVVGLAVIGLGVLFIVFLRMYNPGHEFGAPMMKVLEVLTGFSLGAESIALFARVGGGIYTKAADVGADLVGKVEANIPEDDPRNPAVIADNVGDNVGDVAGMGADLFGSFVATILATMVLGAEIKSVDAYDGMSAIILPLLIAAAGIVFSIIACFFVKVKEGGDPQTALNVGNYAAVILTAGASYFIINKILPANFELAGVTYTSLNVFFAVVVGLVVGTLISLVTEYYCSMGKPPVNSIIQKSDTGAATNIIAGLGVGMISTALPILILAAGIVLSFEQAGLYGVAIAAAGMMATTGMQLAIDAFGPIADNAGGIAEMSGLPKEVRHNTDVLDAVGNTTAAIGKGFAIASAALTSLALFAAFMHATDLNEIDISQAPVLAGLFVGGMIPFVFSSLAMGAVGNAAMKMVMEVRRQFREIKGLMEGVPGVEADYQKCIEISTTAALREMLLPGAMALLVPVFVGYVFGASVLGGMLAGVTVAGVLMAIFQSNAGGAWDNAKKSFEKGVVINGVTHYKGSEPHKASVTGDTVGDPFKDTSGPSMNILIKLMSIVALVIGPHITKTGWANLQHVKKPVEQHVNAEPKKEKAVAMISPVSNIKK